MKIEPATALAGAIAVPGDKSISHRAVLLGALCDGELRVGGFGRSVEVGWASALPEASVRAAARIAIVGRRGSATQNMVDLDSNARV